MIPVAVIARACARSVRAGVMRVAVGVSVGRSARRIVIVKSIPAVSSTRKERKRREETAQRWGFACLLRLGFAGLGQIEDGVGWRCAVVGEMPSDVHETEYACEIVLGPRRNFALLFACLQRHHPCKSIPTANVNCQLHSITHTSPTSTIATINATKFRILSFIELLSPGSAQERVNTGTRYVLVHAGIHFTYFAGQS